MKFCNMTKLSQYRVMMFFLDNGFVYRKTGITWIKDFFPDFHPQEKYSISAERVRQLEEAAMKKLKKTVTSILLYSSKIQGLNK